MTDSRVLKKSYTPINLNELKHKNSTFLNPIANNKIVGIVLMIFSVFGFMVIAHRLSFYVFEYNAQHSPIDYGRYNMLSYFTVQSNFFFYLYLMFASLGIFGVKRARMFAFNPTVGALITTYVIIAGVVFCGGIPLNMAPPFEYDTAAHSMLSFVQIYYHMLMPLLAIALWCFPFTNQKLTKRCLLYVGIYPFVYSLFCIIRGSVSKTSFYPYPFYNPEFIWNLAYKEKPIDFLQTYLMIFVLLIIGILFFAAVTAILMLIHNKRIKSI